MDGLQPNPPSTANIPLPLRNIMICQTWLEDNKFVHRCDKHKDENWFSVCLCLFFLYILF
jgi:hypothetical protein